MANLNEPSLFDYCDEDGEWGIFSGKADEQIKSSTNVSLSCHELQKPHIFQVENFDFLKKKREESKVKNKNKKPWTEKEVN
jgi:hypothetical protein